MVPSGLFILPEQNPSNSAAVAGKLSYTDPPYYQKGASTTTPEQQIGSSVKVLSGSGLQNVVLSGDTDNTYPGSYTVTADDPTGTNKTFNYSQVVSDFTNDLVNQTEGEGKFSIKATMISIIPPNGGQQGTVTWLLQSTGTITRGANTVIASSTIYAYISARVTPVQKTVVVTTGNQIGNAGAGLIARGGINWHTAADVLDSYQSSNGAYNIALAANSYPGQIGTKNVGSRGDLRTNNETISGVFGYVNVENGTVTGSAYATNTQPGAGDTGPNPITIDTSTVNNGRGGSFSVSNEYYAQPPLIFPALPNPPAPPAGAVDYSYSSKSSATLPSNSNGYNNITVTKGQLSVPPGNYGNINVDTQGTIVLGTQGQSTVYNFQGFTGGAQGNIIFKGPVIINVANSLQVGAGSSIADSSVPASAVRWNFVGGAGQLVSIGGNAATLGVFYCPNNDVTLGATGDFYGSIAARSVNMSGTGKVHVDEDAVSGVQYNQQISSTTTSTVGYTATGYSLWRITQALN